MGFITFQLFSNDVNSIDHPYVREFRRILEEMAKVYKCNLTSFAIDHGVVMFHFDNEEVTNSILEDLQDISGTKPIIYKSKEQLIKGVKEILKKARNE